MTPPTKEQFIAAIAKTEQLFPAPRTLGRALFLLRNPQSDLGDIAGLISCDPAMAADVLRCANSAFFGGGTRISALDQAVQRIGFRETLRLLSLVVAHGAAHRDLGSYGLTAEDFWAESLFSGLFLEALARETRDVDSDEAYTSGLLRFIGRLAINQAVEDLGGERSPPGCGSPDEWEQRVVGITHPRAAALLLRGWQIAESITLAVAGQSEPTSLESPTPLIQAMHFTASLLPSGLNAARLLVLDDSLPGVPADHPFLRLRGFTPGDIIVILREAHRYFLAVRKELYQ